MKKALVLVAVLGLIASADAKVRLFFTSPEGVPPDPAQLANRGWDLTDTEGTGTDGTHYNLAGGLSGTNDADLAPTILEGQTAYLWLGFENEPNAAKVQGLQISVTGAGNTGTAYRYNDENDSGWKRWEDGSLVNLSGGAIATLVAITTNGVVNRTPGGDDHLSNNRVVLLGAVKFATADDYYVRLEDLGISYAGRPRPEVALGADSTEVFNGDPGSGGSQSVTPDIHVIPEPASMLLLGLAGLFIRRR